MAFPNKKPNTAMLLGVGPKPKPTGGPPPFGGGKTGSPGAEIDTPATDPAEEPSTGGDLTPDMLDYHAGDENCGACKHFTAPGTCDRFPDPVEETGHCEGFQSGGDHQMQAADMGMPGGAAA